ncbi:MAG: 3,4-dihydroxyphenylacetate 2,3-dioxygenase, partial [Burkholderiaceae bacterium]|nr:3,4-dihydroxyphenylacetate 2,3-dioxygenase [Burkholderiaceae bacterium]
MGKLALAAKITHVPSMYLSELDGPRKGSRQDAIDGHIEIGRRCRELGVDTIVVFDTHWLVNANYHINCGPHFKGLYTSNELPHFISNMNYEFPGNPALGKLLAKACIESGVEALAHDATTLAPEYGTLVPMRYMNQDQHFKVISVSALCTVHYLDDSARLGWAMRKAIEEHYDGTVAFLASGSLSHRFAQNGLAPEYAFKIWSPFL